MKTSLPNLLSTPPAVPVPAAPTGPAARNITPSSPRTLANRSQQTTSLLTTVNSVRYAQTHLPRQITNRSYKITTSPLLISSTTSALQTDNTPPDAKIPIRAYPIATRTSPITTRTSPITTRTFSSFTIQPFTPCHKNHTTRVFAGNGTVSSPGYPDDYPPNMCRTWIFWTSPGKSVVLKFLHFVVEEYHSCKFDNVTIVVDGRRPGQTYCGGGKYSPRPPPSTFTGDATVEVTMLTDGNHQESGIKLQYNSVPGRG
ncbi:uncharacterized protein LOC144919821 [Branchiostoma floridae x Branchiostoma belcheri]